MRYRTELLRRVHTSRLITSELSRNSIVPNRFVPMLQASSRGCRDDLQ
jgi:hypothetical protein